MFFFFFYICEKLGTNNIFPLKETLSLHCALLFYFSLGPHCTRQGSRSRWHPGTEYMVTQACPAVSIESCAHTVCSNLSIHSPPGCGHLAYSHIGTWSISSGQQYISVLFWCFTTFAQSTHKHSISLFFVSPLFKIDNILVVYITFIDR